jgi:ATP-dependent DNA helicase RecQ
MSTFMANRATVQQKWFVVDATDRVVGRLAVAIANVLRGSDTEQVRSRGHETLSVFGLLRDASVDEVRGYIDQLIARGLLRQTDDGYPVLQLTAEGLALMRNGDAVPDLALARQRKVEKDRPPRRPRIESESWDGVDRNLFESLRALRLRIARERGVPPYVIFHDTTLGAGAPEARDARGIAARMARGVRKAEDLGQARLRSF